MTFFDRNNRENQISEKEEAPMKHFHSTFILAAALLLTALLHAEPTLAGQSGQCGDNVYYDIEGGTATIYVSGSGTGAMYDYDYVPEGESAVGKTVSPFFEMRNDITEVNIGGGVTRIGKNAFWDCGNITNIYFTSSGLTDIGDYAFGFTGINSINLPNTVLSIGLGAFEGCKGLTFFRIPDSCLTVGREAFLYCENITDFYISPSNASYSTENGVLFNKNKSTIVLYPPGKMSLSYTIPATVKRIEDFCFDYAEHLTNVVIPEGVEEIGYSAFECCYGLTEISIPDSVTLLGERAFYACDHVKTVSLGSGLTEIGYSVFYACRKLTTVIIPVTVTQIGDGAFEKCTGLTSVFIPSQTTYIHKHAFSECPNLTIYGESGSAAHSHALAQDIPFEMGGVCGEKAVWMLKNGLLRIVGKGPMTDYPNASASPFSNKSEITAVRIEDGITSIGSCAFYGCANLGDVEFNAPVVSIGHRAFFGCTALEYIDLPFDLEEIGTRAFRSCAALRRVIFPNRDITFPMDNVFEGCPNRTIYGYYDTNVRSYADGYGIPFIIMDGPDYPIDFYLPSDLTAIEEEAFMNTDAETVYIGDQVKTIGARAFANSANLRQVRIPEGIESIADDAFEGCPASMWIVGEPDTLAYTYAREHGLLFSVDAVG